jgi:hypothetical protein
MDDFYAILNRYGLEGVKESIKEIPYRTMRVCHGIKKSYHYAKALLD